ncbi:MAG: cytochrome c oxidase subunit II [Firmicutes bacterium]|nr:cytochrome c oxidase subunit II [Bacillota bacterium]
MGDIVGFAVAWIVTSALGELAVSAVRRGSIYYYTASNQALDGESAFGFILVMLVPVVAFIVVMLVYNMIRFRARGKEILRSQAQFYTNKVFVTVWIAISVVVNLLFYLHPTASALEQMFNGEEARYNRQDLIVNVTARQWQWLFNYPQYNITQAADANGNSVMFLPADRTIKFVLRSYDPFHTYDASAGVIHGFWVPAFGLKQDIIPGETRYLYIHTNKITSYDVNPMVRVQCTEVCGPGHPFMEAPVHVVSAADFQKWIASQQKQQQS